MFRAASVRLVRERYKHQMALSGGQPLVTNIVQALLSGECMPKILSISGRAKAWWFKNFC
jgi:hypothetical protein